MAEETVIPKKIVRARKTTTASDTLNTPAVSANPTSSPLSQTNLNTFLSIIGQITQNQQEFEKLLKEIEETRKNWEKEKQQHSQETEQNLKQEEILRKREQEEYEYETKKQRKIAEDEFADKKTSWEKGLQEQKDKIAEERKELESLRKIVDGFEAEKEKAIKETGEILRSQLNNQYETDKKLREQEIKAEKDLLNLRLNNLTAENARQAKEIEELKKTLDQSTKEVKEIAVKVIESSGNSTKNSSQPES